MYQITGETNKLILTTCTINNSNYFGNNNSFITKVRGNYCFKCKYKQKKSSNTSITVAISHEKTSGISMFSTIQPIAPYVL
jgi:hypothetical protein